MVSGLVPLMLAQLGQDGPAIDIKRRRVHGDDSDFMAYVFSPAGARLRSNPGFQGLVEQDRLPALWAKYGPPDFLAADRK